MYNTLTRWYFVLCVCGAICWKLAGAGNTIRFFFFFAFRYFVSLDLSVSSNYEMYVSVWFLHEFWIVVWQPLFFCFVFLFISHFCIHKATFLVFLEQLIQSLSFHNGIQITFHFTFTQIVAYVTERSELNQIHRHRFAIRIEYWILFRAKPNHK